MEKMRMESVDMTEKNIEKIESLFPNCITESKDENGKLKKSINFALLKQMLSNEVVDGDEAYEFTWVGKKAAIVEANKPIRKTLRPCIDESVNWNNTENLYIEGDNLEVLKLLQENYLGRVKMIYIDPPYNTGNDFIYRDDFGINIKQYEDELGLIDEYGNKLFRNTDSNGRFHSDWCSMIYSRLLLARDLLSEDGAIFVSIDDNEIANLIKICDEIFGNKNFVGCISRATGTTTGQDANKIGSSLDYCLVYSKSELFILNGIDMDEKDIKRFNEKDSKGRYSTLQLRKTGNADRREDRPNMFYSITAPDGSIVYPFGPSNYLSRWRVSKESYDKLLKDDKIVWKKNENVELSIVEGFKRSIWIPYVKYYLEGRTKQVSNLFQDIEGNKKASIILKELLGAKGIFDNPKPVEFIKRLIQISTNDDSLILDFFSGSGTTAHAVMEFNKERESNRKFILIQLPELCEKGTTAEKLGYMSISDIGKERIRKVGEIINTGITHNDSYLDTGFRVFKLDDSNMTDVFYSVDNYSQDLLSHLESNIKTNRNDLDLLFGCLLEWGLPLSLPYNSENVEGYTVHNYNSGDLIACFDKAIPDSVIKYIAKQQPLRAVFRDNSFADSPSKINVGEIFKSLAPDTRVKVI
ncbi:MAG: site-specific DNA-methyltransferase [Veillonella sp.]|uniref:site-specific DNA-methyltransferase n=1 Tax=Veillonella sp. TaxID=1926307 RepID=UPI0029150A42|nr:site-specific DNA-methyltransferase [Veillonella sp.]MDU3602678.1 site-specific DNA-methyltransferase [Veillonella sp.]